MAYQNVPKGGLYPVFLPLVDETADVILPNPAQRHVWVCTPPHAIEEKREYKGHHAPCPALFFTL